MFRPSLPTVGDAYLSYAGYALPSACTVQPPVIIRAWSRTFSSMS